MSQLPNPQDKLILFASIDQCKFRRQVVPGDQLRLEVEFLVKKKSVCKMAGKAYVEDKLVAEGVMMCQIVDKPKAQ